MSAEVVKISLKSKVQNLDRIAGARVLLKIMVIAGLWPRRNIKSSFAAKILQTVHRTLLHLPVSLAFCLLMWIEALKSGDLIKAGNVVYMSLALTIYLVKLVNIWLLSTRAWSFIHELECSEIYELQTQEEVDMWLKNQKFFRNVVVVFMSGSVFSGAAAFVGVLFAEDYQLGFPYWVPFEWRNAQRYWMAYGYNVLGIYVSCLSNVALDMLGCYMIFHIGLLYKLLNLRFQQLQNEKETVAAVKIMQFLRLHSSIKRATKDCEILISYYVLSQIVFSALIICFCGYRLQKMVILKNLGQFFAMLQFMSVMILEIFLPCYFANEVTVHSSTLLFNLYNANWLDYSQPLRKFIFLYMEFLKDPVKLRAGGYFEIGLPIFSKVMNNAYSFFALLLNVDN